MSQLRYDVIITGELLDGISYADAKRNVAWLFHQTDKQVNPIFTHKNAVFSRAVSYDEAEAQVEKLKKAGVEATVVRHVPEKQNRNRNTPPEEISNGNASEPPSTPPPQTEELEESHRPNKKVFYFTGEGAEYFRIWVVNVVLTILTLGIYSAWAKVRNKQYFYGNTMLEGTSFVYRAQPLQILKGRLVAFVFFAVYVFITGTYPGSEALFGLVFLIVFPWLVVKSVTFNAHYSEFRNVRFGFDGNYAGAWKAFIGWPILSFLSFGLLFPYAAYKQQCYLVRNHRYGDTHFEFEPGPRPYYRIYLVLIAIGMLAGAVVSLVPMVAASQAGVAVMGTLTLMIYLFLFVYYNVKVTNLRFNHAKLAGHEFEATLAVPGYFKVVLINTLATVVSFGLFLPWAKIRIAHYKADHLALIADSDLDSFSESIEQRVGSLGEGITDVFDLDIGF